MEPRKKYEAPVVIETMSLPNKEKKTKREQAMEQPADEMDIRYLMLTAQHWAAEFRKKFEIDAKVDPDITRWKVYLLVKLLQKDLEDNKLSDTKLNIEETESNNKFYRNVPYLPKGNKL